MNSDYEQEWVKRLRSTDESQHIAGNLIKEKPDGTICHCALGLLVEIGIERGMPFKRTQGNSAYLRTNHDEPAYYQFMPSQIRLAAGLTVQDCNRIVGFNDEARITFESIADIIEKGELGND